MNPAEEFDEPVVGKRYNVQIADCCIEDVTFAAVLTEVILTDDDPEGDFPGYVFDNGVRCAPGWNGGITLSTHEP